MKVPQPACWPRPNATTRAAAKDQLRRNAGSPSKRRKQKTSGPSSGGFRLTSALRFRRAKPAVLADLLDIFGHRVNRRHDAAHHRRFVEESVRAARGVHATKTKTS